MLNMTTLIWVNHMLNMMTPPLTYSNQVTYIYYNHIFNKPRLQSSVTQLYKLKVLRTKDDNTNKA